MRHRLLGTGLTYLAVKLTDIEVYLGLGDLSSSGTHDAPRYVNALQQRFGRWTPEERARIVRRLRLSALGNLVDPTLWLVAYHELVTYLYHGKRYARLPQIPVRSWRLFPGTRFNLSSLAGAWRRRDDPMPDGTGARYCLLPADGSSLISGHHD